MYRVDATSQSVAPVRAGMSSISYMGVSENRGTYKRFCLFGVF